MDTNRNVRIQIVEDESIVAFDIQHRLAFLGYQTAGVASSGEEAIRLAGEEQPDLVLMDIRLKGQMDGVDAAEAIRREHNIPIVFLTAYADDETLERAKVTEAFGYLLKPFQERELLITIEMALYKHRIERDLRENRRRLDATLKSIADGVIVTDADGKVTFANEGARRILGRQKPEGEDFSGLLPDLARCPHAVDDAGERTVPSPARSVLVRPDGSSCPVEHTIAPIDGAGPGDGGCVYVLRDVTEQLRNEELLRAAKQKAETARQAAEIAKKDAEHASRAKSEFLANMSHELRTPLNSIIGLTELAADRVGDPESKEYLDIVRQSAVSLQFLIGSILDFSKIEAGRMELTSESFNLTRCIEKSVENLTVEAHRKGLDLHLKIDPRCTTGLKGDHRRLQQVLINLIGNAVKFTESGTVVVAVEEDQTSKMGNSVGIVISVSDTGIGIPAERIPEIFDAFTQGDGSATRRFGGTGLGLAISRRLVDLMEGSLEVESTPRIGSVFRLSLPFEKAPDFESRRIHPPFTAATECIIAIPEGLCRTRLADVVSRWGARVRFAATTREMLEEWKTAGESVQRFVIADVSLEVREGIVRRSREAGEAAHGLCERLILVGKIGERGERGSGCPYLIEPVREQQLYETIRTILPEVIAGTEDLSPRHDDREVGREPGPVPAILLAEDDPSNRLLATKILQQSGYRVVSAGNGQEAIDALLCERVDCVLMDLQMPMVDGITATERIRGGMIPGVDPELPVIGLTAHAMKEHREKALASGMNVFLTKPFRREELLKALVAVRSGRPGKDAEEDTAAIREIRDRYVPHLAEAHSNGDSEQLLRKAEEFRRELQDAGAGPQADRVFRLILALRKTDRVRVAELIHEIELGGVLRAEITP